MKVNESIAAMVFFSLRNIYNILHSFGYFAIETKQYFNQHCKCRKINNKPNALSQKYLRILYNKILYN
jgi:hypothetical protein